MEVLAQAVSGEAADVIERGTAAGEGGFVVAGGEATDVTGLDGGGGGVEEERRGGAACGQAQIMWLVVSGGWVSDDFGAAALD